MHTGRWLARAGGGAVAGLMLAGAGFGVAVAGATGNSDQYTKGAKPYAGVKPNDITIGTQTFPVSSVTLSVPDTVTLPGTTVTQPYTVTLPYTSGVSATTTTDTQTVYSTTTQTDTSTVTAPGATQTQTDTQTIYHPVTVADTTSSGSAQGGTPTSVAALTALLKIDLRQLLAPPRASDLRIATQVKTRQLRLRYLSPGVGTLKIVWKVVVSKPHRATATLLTSTSTLKHYGPRTLVLTLSRQGRRLLARATSASIHATLTYKVAKLGGFRLTGVDKLEP